MKAIIVSDLHIGSQYFQSQIFEQFIERLPGDHEFILNGDVIDSPYLRMHKSDQKILDLLEQISLRQKVIWLRGNHDNGYMPASFGAVDFHRQYTLKDRLLITHGDDFDDIMPRSRLFIRAFKRMHEIRVKLGAKPVHVAEYAKKWKTLYSVLRKNVALNAVNCARENGFKAVACGHTHFPEDAVYNGIRYLNTGAWTEHPAHFLQVTSDDIVLKTLDPCPENAEINFCESNQPTSTICFNEATKNRDPAHKVAGEKAL
ncbi:MAG: metallophosphoesterase [Deltaproteobacteria bacterium]|nr:metallophosphoesterase [Deltaproteobacteria bacterium]